MSSTLPNARIAVKRIDHVTIVVRDLEQSRHFYCDLLGMKPIKRPGFGFPGLWFQAGKSQVHLILERERCGTPGYDNATNDMDAGLAHHFAFEVEDTYEAARVLKENQIKIMGGPTNRPDGIIQLWFYDPDGHVVEVFHDPDGS